MLSVRAQKLLSEIRARGAGIISEEALCKACVISSHGSFISARKELIRNGYIALRKSGHSPLYVLLNGGGELRKVEASRAQSAEDEALEFYKKFTGRYPTKEDFEEDLSSGIIGIVDQLGDYDYLADNDENAYTATFKVSVFGDFVLSEVVSLDPK